MTQKARKKVTKKENQWQATEDIKAADLEKGQWISPEVLERVFLITREYTLYSRCLTGLQRRIERESLDLSEPLLCKRQKSGLKIMTDEEALDYKIARFRRGINNLERIHEDMFKIRTKHLKSSSRRILAEEKRVQNRVVEAIVKSMGDRS